MWATHNKVAVAVEVRRMEVVAAHNSHVELRKKPTKAAN